MSTVSHRPTRRVVRRSAIDKAYDVLLADVSPAVRPALIKYAEAQAAFIRARDDLTLAKIHYPELRWSLLDQLARELL